MKSSYYCKTNSNRKCFVHLTDSFPQYLYEISDSGQQVVEGDLGLFQVCLGGAEGDALPTPGARCRVGEGGGGADATHHPIPHLAAASHVHWRTPP